jgi:hypothetical protein
MITNAHNAGNIRGRGRDISTQETQLLTLAHELLSSLDVGYQHDLIILDFSKAFDRVPHERLLKKLNHYGIRDSTQGWIKAFLSNRTQQVIVEGTTSDTVPVISGVPQGTVLDPCCS